jgi:aminoglycoside phosphotransferase (APT) family kinase protein
MASIMLPPALADRVESLLGERVRSAEAAVGGHSNLVFSVNDVVIKAATSPIKRADVAREIALLRKLDGLSCASPTVVGSHVDDEWVLLATIKSAGTPGTVLLPDLLANREYGAAFGTLMGRLLRSIHGSAPHPIAGEMFERVGLLADAAVRLASLDIAPNVRDTLLSAIHDPVHQRGVAFLHGDAGLHNVLLETSTDAGSSGLRIAAFVDWELGGWGNPLTDVSWLYWTMSFRGFDEWAWPAFADAYGAWALRAIGWSDLSVMSSILGQMALLLARTDSGTAVRDVWLTRIAEVDDLVIPELSS